MRRTAWVALGFVAGFAVAAVLALVVPRAQAQAEGEDVQLLRELLTVSKETYQGLAQMYNCDLQRLTMLQQIYAAERDLLAQGKEILLMTERIYRSQ